MKNMTFNGQIFLKLVKEQTENGACLKRLMEGQTTEHDDLMNERTDRRAKTCSHSGVCVCVRVCERVCVCVCVCLVYFISCDTCDNPRVLLNISWPTNLFTEDNII